LPAGFHETGGGGHGIAQAAWLGNAALKRGDKKISTKQCSKNFQKRREKTANQGSWKVETQNRVEGTKKRGTARKGGEKVLFSL